MVAKTIHGSTKTTDDWELIGGTTLELQQTPFYHGPVIIRNESKHTITIELSDHDVIVIKSIEVIK